MDDAEHRVCLEGVQRDLSGAGSRQARRASAPGQRRQVAAKMAMLLGLGAAGQHCAAQATSSAALLAQEREAAGGKAWDEIRSFRLRGVLEAGGASGSISQTIDRRSGSYRSEVTMGSLEEVSGFDGGAWVSQNGIVTPIDLPPLLADARSASFAQRFGWRDPKSTFKSRFEGSKVEKGARYDVLAIAPPGGSPLHLWLDYISHLPAKIVAETDGGEQTTLLSDWRKVGNVRLPFRQVQSDGTGQQTTLTVQDVSLGSAGAVVNRPRASAQGRIVSGSRSTTDFQLTARARGHIVVPATAHGQPVNLIFDTGGANYLTPLSAGRLGLTTAGGVNIGGVGETSVAGGFARLDRLTIGTAELRDQAVIVGPLPYPATHPRAKLDVAGLTGYEFLSEFRTILDYEHQRITFEPFDRPPVQRGVTIPFFSDGHSIYVNASIEGVAGLFRLDTGDAGTITIFGNFAQRHALYHEVGRSRLEGGGVGGTVASRELEGRSFILAGARFSQFPLSVAGTKSGAFFSRSLAGNLGAGILSRFTITFDYRARTLTFSPNAKLGQPFDHDLVGLSVSQQGPEAIEVLSVAEGSPAATAGAVAGDAIIAIEGQSVARMELGASDLTPYFYQPKAFHLTVTRGGQPHEITIRPEKF
jgi:hypothetical protein